MLPNATVYKTPGRKPDSYYTGVARIGVTNIRVRVHKIHDQAEIEDSLSVGCGSIQQQK